MSDIKKFKRNSALAVSGGGYFLGPAFILFFVPTGLICFILFQVSIDEPSKTYTIEWKCFYNTKEVFYECLNLSPAERF